MLGLLPAVLKGVKWCVGPFQEVEKGFGHPSRGGRGFLEKIPRDCVVLAVSEKRCCGSRFIDGAV